MLKMQKLVYERIVSNTRDIRWDLPEGLTAGELAGELGVGRNTVSQYLNEYVEQLRIQHAMELIKQTELPVAAIAAACGFNAVNTFYRIFKKYYSAAPSAYRGQDMGQQ